MFRFKFAQNFSSGFKSGEYAGKKMIATPCSFAISRIANPKWLIQKQYNESKDEGIFEVLKVLELDKVHSDCNLVSAIDYFKEKDGIVEQDAPMNFLTECEKRIINNSEKFRSELYCMLLSKKFAEAIENKSIFLQGSFKYSFDSQ